MNKTPNIFKYAPSELSQDAFICYLAEWAKKEYSKIDKFLNQIAIRFIRELVEENIEINELEISRQPNKIDVLLKINNKYVVIIEDKKETKTHSNQLKRYKEIVEKEFKNAKIISVYFKMFEIQEYYKIEEANYKHFNRKKMLDILEEYDNKQGRNSIITEYYQYIKNIDVEINSYKEIPLEDKWSPYAWQGFFSKIREKLNVGHLDLLNTRSGSFWTFHWKWEKINFDNGHFEFFLQLKEKELLFRLYIEGQERDKTKKLREICREYLFEKAKELNINVIKDGKLRPKNPKSVGIGKWSEYRAEKNGVLDIEKTVENIKKIERIVDDFKQIKF